MVATSGPGWRLAPSLKALIDEADRLWPDRDRRSDGSIGDTSHAARTSDHNPYDGWVHAIDLDENLTPTLDLAGFAEHLRTSRDPRVRYVIYEGRIFKSYSGWVWQPYSGSNAHTQHLHVSIQRTDQARIDLRPWFPPRTLDDGDDMAELLTLTRGADGHIYIVSGVTAHHVSSLTDMNRWKAWGAKDKTNEHVDHTMFHCADGPLRTA